MSHLAGTNRHLWICTVFSVFLRETELFLVTSENQSPLSFLVSFYVIFLFFLFCFVLFFFFSNQISLLQNHEVKLNRCFQYEQNVWNKLKLFIKTLSLQVMSSSWGCTKSRAVTGDKKLSKYIFRHFVALPWYL